MRARRLSWRRAGPTLLAALLALAYLAVAPRSPDLADALFRAHLFGLEPFGIWDNLWYAGHDLPAYSVLMPALGWLLGARLLGALAVVAIAAGGEALAHHEDPRRGWLPALWFAAGAVTDLTSGRIAFLLGFALAVGTAVALQRDRPALAPGLAILTALASPVAALFAALAGAAVLLAPGPAEGPPSHDRRTGAATVLGALVPVAVLNVLFPQGGIEPFAASAFWPMPVLAALVLVAAVRAGRPTIATGAVLYAAGAIAAFVLPTAVGGNAVRLGQLATGPILLALALVTDRSPARGRSARTAGADCPHPARARTARTRTRAGTAARAATATGAAILAAALVYLQWQGALRDAIDPAGDPSTTAAYYAPLLRFLATHDGTAARTEIPFTEDHWEAYWVGRRFPLARGWERQLDERDNPLFYRNPRTHLLTQASYDRWLHADAVRWVALPLHVPLDASARQEAALVAARPRYLRLARATANWRIYAVGRPTPLSSGAARVIAMTPSTLTLDATRPGPTTVRVRFSPYWSISGISGCVAPAGPFMRLSTTQRGRFTLRIAFALDRVAARSPRCNKS